jgi:SagB-type dehydrogenase family enzyme
VLHGMTTIAMATDRLARLSGRPGPLGRAGLLEGEASPEEVVVAYHERTKHHFHRYAAALGNLDRATQPDPFRRFAGAELVRLPLPTAGRLLPYWLLYASPPVPPAPLALESVSPFFRYALLLTAWKQVGETRWSLRVNPSSRNLHPTEGYAVLPALDQLGEMPAVYHYAPREHALERRAVLAEKRWAELIAPFPAGAFLVGLSSVHWREAWKYGERAFRYCQHDVGHALASLRFAAAALGWRLALQDGVINSTLSSLLGLDHDEDFAAAEREEAELLVVIAPDLSASLTTHSKPLTAHGGGGLWQGRANTLSPEHGVEWPVIDQVAQATRRCESSPIEEDYFGFPSEEELFWTPFRQGRLSAEKAILGRRSAVAMDGSTAISRSVFFCMLARLIPTHERPQATTLRQPLPEGVNETWTGPAFPCERHGMPWDAIPW